MKSPLVDPVLWPIIGIIVVLLVGGSVVGLLLKRAQQRRHGQVSEVVQNLVQRVNAWWAMVVVLAGMTLIGQSALIFLYGALSFFALRELTTLTTTGTSSKTVLRIAFYILLPVQYLLVSSGWTTLYLVFIPVFAFIGIPTLLSLTSAPSGFLVRTAKLQWTVLVAIYFLSFVPMLQTLPVVDGPAGSPRLLVFLVFTSQVSDVAQYIAGKLFGRHAMAPHISPNKTVEGLVIGGGVAVGLGALLHNLTPFGPVGGLLLAALVVGAGVCGGLVFSSVKRSLGAKDWSASIAGHGGIMDRLDSVVFGAPLLFFAVVLFANVTLHNQRPEWVMHLLQQL